ncbi:hypothetical protein F1654_13485 [Alkalicaulis satelles]|uniref:CSD domain-containing protein n=1 Tax=Alkalicaulis satelles TaxID=2609175 RepID=A0A5M6ZAZ0_9PROT|nr:GIY-YIG nuclease family protein [Alkalicaulis satelles]KAA5801064.1 hypothetical protein F1654_13485 [Alkalicaulis satelles]
MMTLNRERGRNPNLGFGMVPPSPTTLNRYLRAASEVHDLLFGASSNERSLDAISEVKGLCNRVLREDQPDWVVVWLRLGLPSKRRLKWIASDLPRLRKAAMEEERGALDGVAEQLVRAGLGTALNFFISGEEPPAEDGRGYLYLLSTRSDRNLVKIGQTQRSVLKRVEEINRATGVVEPFSPRNIWYVRDPSLCERAAHDLLKQHRVRADREFFRVEFHEASKKITELLRTMGIEARDSGRVKAVLLEKRFGFIESRGADHFFHFSELRGIEPKMLRIGDDVQFLRLDTRLGLAAAEIQRVAS